MNDKHETDNAKFLKRFKSKILEDNWEEGQDLRAFFLHPELDKLIEKWGQAELGLLDSCKDEHEEMIWSIFLENVAKAVVANHARYLDSPKTIKRDSDLLFKLCPQIFRKVFDSIGGIISCQPLSLPAGLGFYAEDGKAKSFAKAVEERDLSLKWDALYDLSLMNVDDSSSLHFEMMNIVTSQVCLEIVSKIFFETVKGVPEGEVLDLDSKRASNPESFEKDLVEWFSGRKRFPNCVTISPEVAPYFESFPSFEKTTVPDEHDLFSNIGKLNLEGGEVLVRVEPTFFKSVCLATYANPDDLLERPVVWMPYYFNVPPGKGKVSLREAIHVIPGYSSLICIRESSEEESKDG